MEHQTDRAVVAGARRAKVAVRQGASQWRRTDALPFEPSRAYHATVGRTSRGMLLSVKGAPENVLERCTRLREGGGKDGGKEQELDAAARERLTGAAEELMPAPGGGCWPWRSARCARGRTSPTRQSPT
ncbi:hypothetical protein LUW77_04405 [Streptomyces radiopugnans]|nr:hypothetical protein LUW77_04405 [Streptomyces radiopugnans]